MAKAQIILTEEQQRILDDILNGQFNACILGRAGTGKSVLISELERQLKENGEQVVLCAPTGVAAENIKGTTIHSLFGLTVGPCITEKTRKVKACTTKGLRNATVVIIDEISMVRLDVLDSIKASLDKIEKSGHHIRLIVVGDFHQLPPIIDRKNGEKEFLESYYGRDLTHPYCFLAPAWNGLKFQYYELTQIIRQQNSGFSQVLNRIADGDISVVDYINQNTCPSEIEGAPYVLLYNDEVNAVNLRQLSTLSGDTYTLRPYYMGQLEAKDVVGYPGVLQLKVGTKVMFTVNDTRAVAYEFINSTPFLHKYDNQFQNGSIATVLEVAIYPEDPMKDYVVLQLENGALIELYRFKTCIYEYKMSGGKVKRKSKGSINQIPIKLAYATTVHKSQGATFEACNVEPGGWDPGQLYVALSRVTDIRNLHLTRLLVPEDVMTDPLVRQFYDYIHCLR